MKASSGLRILLVCCTVLTAILCLNCTSDDTVNITTNTMKSYTEQELISLRDRNEAWLMAQPGVIGTGIGLDADMKIVLRIFTKEISQTTRQSITSKLMNVPIAWEEGDIVAQ